MTQQQHAFVQLAHTARGFGLHGDMTLVEYIDWQINLYRIHDCIDDVQRSITEAVEAAKPKPTG